MLSVPPALINVSVGLVINFTIITKTEWLLLDFLLLFPRQEETFVSHLGDRVNHANAVVNVAAVQQPDVLIGYQDVLLTDRAHAISIDCVWLLIFLSLRWEIPTKPHRLWLCWIKSILKLWKALCLHVSIILPVDLRLL